jgi:hypothetical protein
MLKSTEALVEPINKGGIDKKSHDSSARTRTSSTATNRQTATTTNNLSPKLFISKNPQ